MVQQKINSLSSDEDERQEMWVRYLETPDSIIDLEEESNKIKLANELDDIIIKNIVVLFESNPSKEMVDILNVFSELEKSILILLILGLSKEQISKYKKIDMLHLTQLLRNLSTHSVWGEYFDKKKINR